MAAGRTFLARICRLYKDHHSAAPGLFIADLAPELSPALVEDNPVKPGLLPDMRSGILHRPLCRCAQGLDAQVLKNDESVVFAHIVRDPVQPVRAYIGNPAMKLPDDALLVLPVV